jgi:ribulose-5-phosphate 4-epimerase/fuculose-1-phosphate aldolase
MNLLEKNIKEISAVARILWERGWAESSAGNISVDITGSLKLPRSAFRKNRFSYIDPVYPELSSSLFLATGTGARMRDAAERPLAAAFYRQTGKRILSRSGCFREKGNSSDFGITGAFRSP